VLVLHPVLGVSVHGRSIFSFSVLDSESAKKFLGEKKGRKNHPPKKARAHPFVLARWRQKKKVGVEQNQEEAGHVRGGLGK
jgi:hypothetical protein